LDADQYGCLFSNLKEVGISYNILIQLVNYLSRTLRLQIK
jgi:hypothetical protein